MKKLIPLASALALIAAPVAFAQTKATEPSPSAPSNAAAPPAQPMPESKSPVATPPSTAAMPSARDQALTLTDAEAKNWISKVIYSSDGKNLGEVAAFARDSSGKVTEMHGDLGGFLGIGETRVRLTPAQFKLAGDRVVLNMTAEQAKSLPAIKK